MIMTNLTKQLALKGKYELTLTPENRYSGFRPVLLDVIC